MEQENYFDDIISNKEHFYDIPDCISECYDYKDLIEKALKLTNGQLNLESFSCSAKGMEFQFELKVNQDSNIITVKKASDYVDANGLIMGLNQILKTSRIVSDKKFVDLVGGPVDFGVAYISVTKEMELAKKGMIWRNDQFYLDFTESQKSNTKANNLENNNENPKTQKKPWWKIW